MKILMLTSGTPNSRLTYRIVALGQELVKKGHEVTMIAPSLDRHSGWKLDRPAKIGDIKMVYPMQLRTRSYFLNLVPYIVGACFEVLRRRSDLIYVYKPTPATVAGLLGKLIRRTPMVLDMDDLGSEVMRAEGRPEIMCRLVAACERMTAVRADALVVASRLLEREYRTKYPHKRILRLSNGVDPQEITPVTHDESRPAKIIFFGMLGRAAILATLIRVLPEIAREAGRDVVQVEVLGDGAARGELEALAREKGVSDLVTFRGWTTFDQLMEYGAAGDIAICTTPLERTTAACSNQKVFQYMALSWASVVSNVGDLPLYVEDGKAGIVVEAGDEAGLARAITYLLKRPAKRAALGAYARSLAEGRYSWATLAGNLNRLLEAVS